MSNGTANEFLFTWKIKNYSNCLQQFNEAIESPLFAVESICSNQWNVEIYPKGRYDVKNCISCFLNMKKPDANFENIIVNFSLEVIRTDGTVFKSEPMVKREFTKGRSGWGYSSFIKVNNLTNEMKTWNSDDLLVRCRIICDNELQKHKVFGCEAATQIGIDRGIFKSDFLSPTFLAWSEVIPFRISAALFFELTLTAPGKDVLINILWRDKSALIQRVVKIKLTFLDRNGIVIDSKESQVLENLDNFSWNFPKFIKKKQLEVELNGLMFYVFTIRGEVISSNGTILSRIKKYSYESNSPLTIETLTAHSRGTSIQNNFRDLFTSKKLSDVKIRVGDEEFLSHKSVLAARSPVFAAMFDQEMNESKTGIVEIHDVHGEILNKFLEYIYTDNVEKVDYDVATRLLLVADKYEVVSLKEKCVDFLISILSVETVYEVIIIADMINHSSLKKSVFKLIKENKTDILGSSNWLGFIKSNSELATQVLIMLSENIRSVTNRN